VISLCLVCRLTFYLYWPLGNIAYEDLHCFCEHTSHFPFSTLLSTKLRPGKTWPECKTLPGNCILFPFSVSLSPDCSSQVKPGKYISRRAERGFVFLQVSSKLLLILLPAPFLYFYVRVHFFRGDATFPLPSSPLFRS